MTEPEELQRENLQRMVSFLSRLAQVCRYDARQPGTLGRSFDELKKKMDFVDPTEREKDLRGVLSYLFYIGEDLFAFYLLLWELVLTADLDA